MSETTTARRLAMEAVLGDGRVLLTAAASVLLLSGAFALVQSATGRFLPHDVAYLGMDARQLCVYRDCRIVLFMFHDRVTFGGVLVALGLLYLWLQQFPLRAGEPWAWWTLTLSAGAGFASFLTYLGTGYLDTWHGLATLCLLPLFVAGLARARPRGTAVVSSDAIGRMQAAPSWRTRAGAGRALLLVTGVGQVAAGATIAIVGMTRVFVPQDLAFIGLSAAQIRAIHVNLVPLIAHDRAGFGGALFSCGVAWIGCVWRGAPSRRLWRTLLWAGVAGFGSAIGVHVAVGYLDLLHLAPALAGAAAFAAGIALSRPSYGAPI